MSLNSARSANSRRSRNSNISNQSSKSNSNNSNKKQKTLGAAWGANSLASSRSSFRKAPFSDVGSYMVVKNDKLRDQFDAEALSSSQGGSSSTRPIFQGVSIFVDGFTIPSSQELRAYMLKHGGHFENYFSRHRVTHIICSHLPDSKIKNLRSFSRGIPVVKPTWVLDSVAARKLLSWVPYQLNQLNEACNQPKLFAFFSSKINCASDEGGSTVPSSRGSDGGASTVPFSPLKADSLDSESGSVVKDTFPLEVGELSKCARQCGGENDSFSHRGKGVRKAEETTYNKGHLETEVDEPRSANSENLPFEEKRQFNPLCPSASASASHLEEASTLLSGGHYYRHSTIGDPNFVENYFKSSRLHFIGTWRNRYRRRFFSQSSGSKHNSLVINALEISGDTTIIHIDMDCFFVSVIVRNRPELRDKPVAVCHSDSQKGTAEISSANYPARDYGVKAGMFVRDAKSLCPHLLIVPYNFEAYEEVADQFYNILHKHCNKVQAVSCDEAFLDVTHSEEKDPELLASVIRKEIFEATGCTASAGISGNLLMARLATRSAKPDGQYYINPEKVDEYLLELPIKALPGIGNVLDKKLRKIGVQTCGQLRMIPKECLQKDFGEKTGEMLWSYSRGVDNRPVGAFQESKSVGAEVNWGVRFNDLKDCHCFLASLCKEVSLRLQGCGAVGRTFTLKIKKRRKGAEEPSKYMGCGDCENLSHSTTVTVATDDVDVLQRITLQLFGYFSIDVKDIRGVGLQVSKLENADYAKQDKNTLRSWLTSASGSIEQSHKPLTTSTNDGTTGGQLCASSGGLSSQNAVDPLHQRSSSSHDSALPSLHDLDIGILKSLPPDLFLEINEVYGGKLINFISRGKEKIDDIAGSVNTSVVGQDIQKEETCKQEIYKAGSSNNGKIQALSASAARSASGINPGGEFQNPDLMPSSLSQMDISVFDQLPAELRADIVGKLPTHRKEDCPSDPVNVPAETIGLQGNNSRFIEPASNKNLCEGSPPYWVDKFKKSNCLVLNVLAEMYSTTGCVGKLSSLLQQSISQIQLLDAGNDGMLEAISTLCELVKQYIKLKLETDLEELYICFRLLKRLAMKSEVFREVYDDAFPFLQLSVGESYGGFLHFSSPK